jgi:Flp pilus assembly protein TadD
LPADGPEIFWNFVIPVPLTRARWVKAVEIRPGAPKAIHHASIILDRSHSARDKHPEGFSGMDLNIAESSFDPDGTFLAWKPGSVPMVEPDGMAWHATPGMDLILNAHLRPTGKPETVQPSIGLYFTDQPQTKFPLLIELEHDGAIDIPPGAHDYLVSDDFTTPLDIKVLAIYPHAHYLGKLLEGYATLPGGERKWLIRIPEWDLSWQGVFHYKQPVFLPRGTKISMRFHYDNSAENIRNPHHPPVRVRGGSHADDEMGNLWLQVLPAIEADQRPALQEAVMRRLLEKYPSDFSANYILGDLLLSKGDAVNAIRYFEAASTAEPRNAVAAAEWGVALASAKRMAEAKRQFERALALDPKFTDARYDLASAQAAEGDFESAARNLRQAITERPTEPKFGDRLGEVLFAWGDAAADAGQHTEAVEHYREALSYRSEDPELHTNLGVELAKLGQLQPAETELVTALRLKPDLQPARAALEVVRAQVARKLQ